MKELEKLLEGNRRFVEEELAEKELQKRREEVVGGQKPYVTMVTCSDSRVVPEYIFDANLGELFIIRVAGNICDNAVLGSIEYGTEHLKTPLLVILGHTKCGAVTASCKCKGKKEGNNIDYIIGQIAPAVKEGDIEKSIEENLRCVEKEIIKKSKSIKKLLKKKELIIIKMKYYLETGKVKIIEG